VYGGRKSDRRNGLRQGPAASSTGVTVFRGIRYGESTAGGRFLSPTTAKPRGWHLGNVAGI
jgi:hypothetical protein